MLSSSNFDAFYVQHPGAAGGSGVGGSGSASASSSNGGQHHAAAHGDPHLGSMLSESSSIPLHLRSLGTGGRGQSMRASDFEHIAMGQQGGHFAYNAAVPAQQHLSHMAISQGSPPMPVSWNGAGPGHHAKDGLFQQHSSGRSSSPLWDTSYSVSFDIPPQQELGMNSGSLQPQLFGTYDRGQESAMLGDMSYSGPSLSLSDDLKNTDGTGSFLLSQYDLDLIGDDSGSGGKKRPTPKNKRRQTQRARTKSNAAQDETAQFLPAMPSFDQVDPHHGHPDQIDVENLSNSASGVLDELGGLGPLEDVASTSNSFNETGELDILPEGLEGTEDEPLYVNPKQYNRILKRREVRARMEEKRRITEEAIRSGKLSIDKISGGRELAIRLGLTFASNDDASTARRGSASANGSVNEADDGMGNPSGKRTYQHESRHKHAMRRPRGPGGRFLTAEEIKAKEAAEAAEAHQQAGQINVIANHSQDANGLAAKYPAETFDPKVAGQVTEETSTQRDDEDDTYNLLNLE